MSLKRYRHEAPPIEDSSLIWHIDTSIASTGSVLVRLAQNGYTREANTIISLSRTASLVGRDSNGGLTELWDVMGRVAGKNGITRLMAVAINRSSNSIQRILTLLRDHGADPSIKDAFGRTALHHALGFRHESDTWPNKPINEDLVRVLVNACPAAVKEICMGTLPLHYACKSGVSVEVVYLLFDKFVDAVRFQDNDGMLPIHHLCASTTAPFDVAELLHLEYPEGFSVEDTCGRTPLMHALGAHLNTDSWPVRRISKEDTALISLLVDTSPETILRVWDGAFDGHDFGGLPILYACKNKAPAEILEILHRPYPQTLQTRNQQGRLPLHEACASASSLKAIQYLLDHYPQGASISDRQGMMPLHHACVTESCDNVKLLVERYPTAQMICSFTGLCPSAYLSPSSPSRSFLLPVHCAIENNAPVDTIRSLIQSSNDSIRQCDGRGMLPIHLACEMKSDVEIIRALLISYPEGASMKHRGLFPLGLACERKLGIDVIQCFLDNNAACVLARNEFQRLALHIACIYNDESSADLDVIRLLLHHYPKGSEVKDYFGRVPSSYINIKNSKGRAIFSNTLSTAYSLSTTLSLSATTSDRSTTPYENDQKLLESFIDQ